MTTVITINNISTHFTTLPGVESALYTLFGVYQPGYRHTDAYKRGRWDGKIRFYDARRHTLPTGLLPQALAYLTSRGHTYDLNDHRPTLPQETDVLPRTPLREYQKQALEHALHGYEAGLPWPRGVLQLPTGSGKTLILAAIIARFEEATTLLLTHRRELLHQTRKVLRHELQLPIGIIGDGTTDIQRVTVGMVGTLASRTTDWFPYLKGVSVLLHDEVHHASADTHQDVILRCVNAGVRIGVSATPFRAQDPVQTSRVTGVYGGLRYHLRPQDLVEENVTAPVTVEYIKVGSPTSVPGVGPSYGLSWPLAYEHLIMLNERRNQLIAEWVQEAPTEPTLIIVNRLEHGRILAERLEAPFMTGSEPTAERMRALKALHDRQIPVLIGTTIFDEGINVPSIRRVVLAAGGKSEVQVLQRIGRGVRMEHPTDTLTVLDFWDVCNRHLIKHSRERFEVAKQAGYAQMHLTD